MEEGLHGQGISMRKRDLRGSVVVGLPEEPGEVEDNQDQERYRKEREDSFHDHPCPGG